VGPTSSDAPRIDVDSADGTPIAVFEMGGQGRPLVLVHGASADHTTWRVVGPLFARSNRVLAVDRRGRGRSGDRPPYHVVREFEDLAAVADQVTSRFGGPVTLVGHSFGGRVCLGAALRSAAVDRLIVYESAPPPPGQAYQSTGLADRLRELADRGDGDRVLATFMTEVVGMAPAELAAYRADPIWPRRTAAAHTIVRELDAETAPEASLDALARVRQPVLQILGGDSLPVFTAATRALDERLVAGRIGIIPGARHAAHHTHAEAFVAAVDAFLRSGAPTTAVDMRD
jgi:pimeloyl-ACP methyl ester carboxylesterase